MDDEYLNFYHISRDASDEKAKKFLSEGIVPEQVNGYGGQSNGFYCWTNEDMTDKYYSSLLVAADTERAMEKFSIDIRLKDEEALKVEISVKKDTIQYPDWQLSKKEHKMFNDKDETFKKIESLRDRIKGNNINHTYEPTQNISKFDFNTLKAYKDKMQNG